MKLEASNGNPIFVFDKSGWAPTGGERGILNFTITSADKQPAQLMSITITVEDASKLDIGLFDDKDIQQLTVRIHLLVLEI